MSTHIQSNAEIHILSPDFYNSIDLQTFILVNGGIDKG